ncbi:MAG: class I mannose-6-phosphate isomerase, partial [Bacteroidales bacterium]|nr:class I mannose-6-phosphate isomerase [Bacteroidales bacterium]
MNKLYPLIFKPIFKEKIWGGQKIKTVLGKDFSPLPNCGEVWVLSGVENNQTVIENGFLVGNDLNEIVEVYMGDLLGDKIFQRFGNEFPILIKFIDANDWLSIQVHPDDGLAWKRHNSLGKTEMWYIFDAEKDAELISGFSTKLDKESYQKHLENKTLKSVMNFEKVKNGDVYYMPAGRVHALGPGILLAEIQQTSDVTYRIYDWDRIDEAGMMRDLHTEEALDALDFQVYDNYKTNYDPQLNKTVKLVESPYFTTNLIHLSKPIKKDYSELDSFVIYVCAEGKFELKNDDQKYSITKGEALLLPAILDQVEIYPSPETKILEV